MNATKKLIAHVPESFREGGIEWLVLEADEEDTGGVFLYCHQSMSEASDYDSWHEDVESAQAEAEEQWGVGKYNWMSDNQE
jgi:hypothetical protein